MAKKKTALTTVIALILIVTALLGIGFYQHIVDGALVKKVFMSSDAAVDYYTDQGQEVIFDYQNEGIRIFFINNDGTPHLYIAKEKLAWWRLSFWAYDYPSYNNIFGITTDGDEAFICTLGKPGKTMFLQTETGTRLDPIVKETMQVSGSSSSPDEYVVNIFKLEDYAQRPGDYQVLVEDADGNILNMKTSEFDLDEITLHLLTRDDSQGQTYSPEEVSGLSDAREQVVDVFLETIANKTAVERMSFEGSKLPMTQKDISTSTTLGYYYTVNQDGSIYSWTHRVSYQLKLNGDHYKNILIRHESTPPLGASKVSYYKVESSEAINDIYDLFFPQ